MTEIEQIQEALKKDKFDGVVGALDYLDRVKRIVVEIREAQIEDGEAWYHQERWADELEGK
jgi:hypothetical protein